MNPIDDNLAPLEGGSYYDALLHSHHVCEDVAVRYVGDAAVGYLDPGCRHVRCRVDQEDVRPLTAYEETAAA